MASGAWGLICNPGTPVFTGDFIFNADVNVVLPAPGSGNPNKVGTLLYTFLPGEFYLDGVLLTGIDQLPQGFELLDIDREPVTGEIPTTILIGGAAVPSAVTSWSIPEMSWTESSNIWDIIVGTQAILTGITFSLAAETDDLITGSTFISGAVSPSGGFPNIGVITGTWDDLGAVIIPGAATVIEGPGPGNITVTPGSNTVIVVVTTPGNPEIIVPVTPGVPVVIPVPATPATVTPYNVPIVPGTSVVIGDVVIEGDLTIDVALAATLQFLVNPSGIYTLVPGKHYDTLYQRLTNTTTSQDVKIPNPFVKTYLVGD